MSIVDIHAAGSELQLETRVARYESETLVEAMRIGACGVGRELHQGASVASRFVDRPGHQLPAETRTAVVGADAHGFDLATEGTSPGQAGDEGQLQRRDRFVGGCGGHDQELVGVGHDPLECPQIRLEVVRGVTSCPELVVREHAHDRGDVFKPRTADVLGGHGSSITASG